MGNTQSVSKKKEKFKNFYSKKHTCERSPSCILSCRLAQDGDLPGAQWSA